jgi:hypothetical protein
MSKPRKRSHWGAEDCEASHIDVLRALAVAEMQPPVYAGSSAGALAPMLTPVH